MQIKRFSGNYSVCKVLNISDICFEDEFCFMGKTDEELSLVCLTESVPDTASAREDGWKLFRIEGELDFSLIGILSKITSTMAEHKISVFAVSTFNTDYILIKEQNYDKAMRLLEISGYQII